jgi:hypothetical protein
MIVCVSLWRALRRRGFSSRVWKPAQWEFRKSMTQNKYGVRWINLVTANRTIY